MKEKVVLAYSGGLDTSYCVKYLSEELGLEVYTALANTGGFTEAELKTVEKKAYALGAKEHVNLDVTEDYYEKCIRYMVFGNVLRNKTYPVSVSSERTFQALAIVNYAKKVGAQYIAHGSTGAGNDQVRFDLCFAVFAPEMKVITPTRDLRLSRETEIGYLKAHGVHSDWKKMEYSVNKGIWGTSVGGKETLHSKRRHCNCNCSYLPGIFIRRYIIMSAANIAHTACYILLAPLLGGLMSGMDRIISARMQGRQGPPLLQPFYDIIKLFSKETVSVKNIQVCFLVSYLFFVIASGALFFAGLDLLMVFFVLTTANIFLVIAATSTNSPYSNMGAQRELIQMMAYEPMTLITAVGVYLATGSFSFHPGSVPLIVKLPGVFAGFMFILVIKLRKHPFDLATSHQAHQEMVKGVTTEFSGKIFAIDELAAWYENIFLFGMLMMFFITDNKISIPISFLLASLCYFVLILIDNSNARMKWQKMLKNTWIVTAVIGAVNLLVLYFFN